MLWLNKHARHRDNLSPYVDGRLTPAETAALETHLAACEPCRHELAELRAAVAAVRDLPQLETPRSFALSPQMLERRRALAPAPSAPPLALGMRMASAAVAVVLAVVVIGDLSGGGNGSSGDGALESTSRSRDATELAPGADAESDEPAGAAPAATGVGEQYDFGVAEEDATATTAPPAGNFTEVCPTTGGQAAGGTGAFAPTPAPGTSAQPASSPTPTGGASGGAGGAATRTCDEKSIAANQSPTPAEVGALSDAVDEEGAPEAAASSAGDDGGISTLRVLEIVLGGSLLVLLVGVAADFALRGRPSV